MSKRLALVLMWGILLAAPASAQTLGETARREAARRGDVKEPVKVYTNADLAALPQRRVPAATALAESSLKPSDTAASVEPAPSAEPQEPREAQAALPQIRDKRPEDHWRERARVIRTRLDRLRADATAVEGRVDALRAQLATVPASRVAALEKEIQQASADLDRFRGEIVLIEGEWTAFEQRARQAKIPLDWIR